MLAGARCSRGTGAEPRRLMCGGWGGPRRTPPERRAVSTDPDARLREGGWTGSSCRSPRWRYGPPTQQQSSSGDTTVDATGKQAALKLGPLTSRRLSDDQTALPPRSAAEWRTHKANMRTDCG
ncbi:hypothetical protein NDU88_000754 [Pleurodeles waltl]|uniref:Uncharacterized protein n=1 Tax=Pleurodeles waltl TaxID=8319 RepID=A0AAV7VWZ2_PLEWA|nr:hypothetical protein NDU88_000754 [Pleurodeles waltl]